MIRRGLLLFGLVLLFGCGFQEATPVRGNAVQESSESRSVPTQYVPRAAAEVTAESSLDLSTKVEDLSLMPQPLADRSAIKTPVEFQRDQPQTTDSLQNARLQFRQGDHQAAIRHYREFLRQRPDDVVALLELGMSLNAVGEHGRATPILDQAIRHSPDYLEAYLERGNTFLKRGLARQALLDFQRAHELAADRADILCAIANTHLELRMFADAEEHAGQAIQIDSKYALGYIIRGISRARQGNLELAEQDLELARATGASARELETLTTQIKIAKENLR